MQNNTTSTLVTPFTSSNSTHSIQSNGKRRLSLAREPPEPVFASLHNSKEITLSGQNKLIQQSIEISRRGATPEINENETEDESSSDDQVAQYESEWVLWLKSKQTINCWLSIVYCSILLIFLVLLSSIWMVALGLTLESANEKLIALDSLNAERNIENTLNTMLILSESSSSQLKRMINNSLDNLSMREFNFFGVYKAVVEKELDLISAMYVGDAFGNKIGITYFGGELYLLNSSQFVNKLTFCKGWTSSSECEMGASTVRSNTDLGIEDIITREQYDTTKIIGMFGRNNTVRLLKKWIDQQSNFYYLTIDLSMDRITKKALVPTMYYSQIGNIMLIDTNSSTILGKKSEFSTLQMDSIKKSKPKECSQQVILPVEEYSMFLARMCFNERLDLLLITSIPSKSITSSMTTSMLSTLAGGFSLFVILSALSIVVTCTFLRPFFEIFQMVDENFGLEDSHNGVTRKKNLKVPLLRKLFEYKFLREKIEKIINPIRNSESFVQKHPIMKYESNSSISRSTVELKSSQHLDRSQSKEGIGSFLSNSFKFAKKKHQQVIEERDIICIGVTIDGLLGSSSTDIVLFLLEFCEKITTMSSQKGCKAGFMSTNVIGLFFNHANNTFPVDKVVSNCFFFLDQLEKIKFRTPLKYRMVIFQQKVLCGLSTPTIFTPLNTDYLLDNISKINDISSGLDLRIVVPEYFKREIHDKYYNRYVGNVFLFSKDNPLNKKDNEIYNLYEIGEEKLIQQDQEWMYELHEKTKKHKWDEYNKAHQLLEQSKMEEARELLNILVNEQTHTDHPTLQLLRLCENTINNKREMSASEQDHNDTASSSIATDFIL